METAHKVNILPSLLPKKEGVRGKLVTAAEFQQRQEAQTRLMNENKKRAASLLASIHFSTASQVERIEIISGKNYVE